MEIYMLGFWIFCVAKENLVWNIKDLWMGSHDFKNYVKTNGKPGWRQNSLFIWTKNFKIQ